MRRVLLTTLLAACSDGAAVPDGGVFDPFDGGTSPAADAGADAPQRDAASADAGVDGGSAAPRGPWHVVDGELRAPDGRTAVLRGVNLANAHKTAPYLGMETADDWLRLRRDFGFNAVRFLMTWAAVEPERGTYDDAYLDRVRERLTWAEQANLVVILDMHQDVYGEGFGFDGAPRWTCDASRYEGFTPTTPWFLNNLNPNVVACVDGFYRDAELNARFVAAWQHVAARLHDLPSVIGFDVLNEPVWGTHLITSYERDLLMPLYTRVVEAVRSEAPGWVAFLEPGASRNGGLATSLGAFPFPDVVYAPHSYDTAAESDLGFDASRRTAILDNAVKLREEATKLNAALWIGEYGGNATAPGIGAYMDAEYDAFAAVGASSMYWAYDRDEGYGLLNPDGSEKEALTRVLVRPYPERVAGRLSAFAWDEDSGAFTLDYEPDPAQDEPTVIVVPGRCYPNGYTVDCTDCDHQTEGDVLRVRVAPSLSFATVTLRPR